MNIFKYLIILLLFILGCKHPIPDIGEEEKIFFYDRGEEKLQMVDLDGKNKKPLSLFSKKEMLGSLQWFPDGKRLFFSVYRYPEGGKRYIHHHYICDFEKKKLYRLKEGFNDGVGHKWSQDGSKVVYESNTDTDIYIMDSNGRNKRNLTNTPNIVEMEPNFHPDGKKILFYLYDRDNLKPKGLYTINIDGSELKKLTTFLPSFKLLTFTISYSPDGSLIAFIGKAPDDTYPKIYLMDTEGKNLRRLTNNSIGQCTFCWSPDGKKIAFYGKPLDKSGKAKGGGYISYIYTVNIDGSDLRLICPVKFILNEISWRPRPKKESFSKFSQ